MTDLPEIDGLPWFPLIERKRLKQEVAAKLAAYSFSTEIVSLVIEQAVITLGWRMRVEATVHVLGLIHSPFLNDSPYTTNIATLELDYSPDIPFQEAK